MADVTARSLQYEYKAVSMHMNEPFIGRDVTNLGSLRIFNYFLELRLFSVFLDFDCQLSS